jgi:hypothetical protein
MKNKWIMLLFSGVMIAALSGCSLSQATPTTDPGVLNTIVAQSIQLTQMAGTLTAVIAQESATPKATFTPSFTATLASTPTETTTPTLESGVWLLFDNDTNCRSGPGTSYPIITKIDAGNKLQAIARSEGDEFFYVRYFDTANHYCWVWKGTSYVTGNTHAVPMYTTVPTKAPSITPTVESGFNVSYKSLQTCSSKYSLLFNVMNTGNITWKSIKIVVQDNTKGVTVTHTSNSFTGYTGCNVTQTQSDLATGEPGLVSTYNPGEFSFDPTGDSLTITVSLYSSIDNSGTVVSKTFSIKP